MHNKKTCLYRILKSDIISSKFREKNKSFRETQLLRQNKFRNKKFIRTDKKQVFKFMSKIVSKIIK